MFPYLLVHLMLFVPNPSHSLYTSLAPPPQRTNHYLKLNYQDLKKKKKQKKLVYQAFPSVDSKFHEDRDFSALIKAASSMAKAMCVYSVLNKVNFPYPLYLEFIPH